MIGMCQTATVLGTGPSSTDAEGNSTSSATSRSYACRLDRLAADERVGVVTTELTTWRLFLPAGAEVGAHDRVLVDGVPYEVDGPPHRVFGARAEHHVEAQLRAVTA